jgi:predicted phosphodiesterase
MTDCVAVLSDIHGVLPALDAVLAEPDVAAADRVVLTGDLAAGPLPAQTLERLTSVGDRAVWVRGNADRDLVELAGGGDTKIPDPIAPWAAGQLSKSRSTCSTTCRRQRRSLSPASGKCSSATPLLAMTSHSSR